LGIGGKAGHIGKLIFFRGEAETAAIAGHTELPRWQWHHVALVRDGLAVRVYLNGRLEVDSKLTAKAAPAGMGELFLGGRCDNSANWEGRLDEAAVFDRALSGREVAKLAGK
jgi:hypothetical protein